MACAVRNNAGVGQLLNCKYCMTARRGKARHLLTCVSSAGEEDNLEWYLSWVTCRRHCDKGGRDPSSGEFV